MKASSNCLCKSIFNAPSTDIMNPVNEFMNIHLKFNIANIILSELFIKRDTDLDTNNFYS